MENKINYRQPINSINLFHARREIKKTQKIMQYPEIKVYFDG